MTPTHRTDPRHRRRRNAWALAIVTSLLAVPLGAWAGTVFDDVDDTDAHIEGITFVKNSGVSVGCDANNNYCPTDNVTRAQMATFMYRLSGNDEDTAPSVNADRVDGFDAHEIVRASYDQTDSLALAGTDGVAAETTMIAPTDGMLIIHASSHVETSSTGDSISCEIDVDGIVVAASRRGVHVDFPDQPVDVCATDVAVEVEAGTYTIEYRFFGLLVNSVVNEAALTVLYVPFHGSLPDLSVPAPPSPPVVGS